jgi:hypothetical protein
MKKKHIRAIRSAIVALLVLVAVGVVAAVPLANAAVKAVVQKAGVKTLNVSVEIERVRTSLLTGSGRLHQIAVANPAGYRGPSLLTLKSVDASAEVGSLLGDELLFHSVHLEGMEVFVEQDGLRNNLYEVIEPLRGLHKPTGRALVVDRLTIGQIVVHVSMPSLTGQSQTRVVDLQVAPITMTDLGRNERMDTKILIGKVLLAVAAGVAEQGGDILPKETVGQITDVLAKALDIGRILFGGKKDP